MHVRPGFSAEAAFGTRTAFYSRSGRGFNLRSVTRIALRRSSLIPSFFSPPAPPAVPIHPSPPRSRSDAVLRWSLIFLIVALVAGLFGFTEVAGPSMLIAKVLFFVFLVLFVVSLLLGSRTTRDVV